MAKRKHHTDISSGLRNRQHRCALAGTAFHRPGFYYDTTWDRRRKGVVPEAKPGPNRMADYKLCEKVNRAESPVYFYIAGWRSGFLTGLISRRRMFESYTSQPWGTNASGNQSGSTTGLTVTAGLS